MLPKEYRLPSSEARGLMRQGKRFSVPSIQLIAQKNTLNTPRFAFVVSTKIDKRATARNRMKRLLRESATHCLPSVSAGWDILIIVKRSIYTLSQSEVESIVKSLLNQALIIAS